MCFESWWFPYFTSLQGFFLAWIICTILRMTRRACLSWFTSPWLPIFSELVLEHWEGKNWPLCSAAFLPSDHPTTSACRAWGPGKYLERIQNPNPNAMLHAPCIPLSWRFLSQAQRSRHRHSQRTQRIQGSQCLQYLDVKGVLWHGRGDEIDLAIAVIAVSRLALAAQARQHERVHPQLQHPLRSEGLAKSCHPYAAHHLVSPVLEYNIKYKVVFAASYCISSIIITTALCSCRPTCMILQWCLQLTTMYMLLAGQWCSHETGEKSTAAISFLALDISFSSTKHQITLFQEIVHAFQVSEEISLVKTHSHESKAALPSELCQADVAKSRFWAFSVFSSAFAAWTASGVGAPAAAASTRSPFLSADFSCYGHNKMMSVYVSHIGQPLLQLPLLWPSHIKLVKVRKPWMKHFQDELSSLSNTFQQVFQQRRLETGFRDGLVQCDCGLCRGMPSTPSGCCNRRTQCQHEYFYILGLSEPLHSVRSIAIAVYIHSFHYYNYYMYMVDSRGCLWHYWVMSKQLRCRSKEGTSRIRRLSSVSKRRAM